MSLEHQTNNSSNIMILHEFLLLMQTLYTRRFGVGTGGDLITHGPREYTLGLLCQESEQSKKS
eukprot:161379-Amphidinium_carterae.1